MYQSVGSKSCCSSLSRYLAPSTPRNGRSPSATPGLACSATCCPVADGIVWVDMVTLKLAPPPNAKIFLTFCSAEGFRIPTSQGPATVVPTNSKAAANDRASSGVASRGGMATAANASTSPVRAARDQGSPPAALPAARDMTSTTSTSPTPAAATARRPAGPGGNSKPLVSRRPQSTSPQASTIAAVNAAAAPKNACSSVPTAGSVSARGEPPRSSQVTKNTNDQPTATPAPAASARAAARSVFSQVKPSRPK